MSRFIPFLMIGSLVIPGCKTAPNSFVSTTPEPANAITCALAQLASRGYKVTNKDAESRDAMKPTRRGIADAREILQACGTGEIAEEVCSARFTFQRMSSCR